LHKSVSINVIFVSHQKIRALNKKYLQKDYATDVLAFDLSNNVMFVVSSDNNDHKFLDSKKNNVAREGVYDNYLIGDIFISTDAAIANMKRYNTSLGKELLLYIIHGILHLLGYDDKDPLHAKKMRNREDELLCRLKGMEKKILVV